MLSWFNESLTENPGSFGLVIYFQGSRKAGGNTFRKTSSGFIV